MKKADDAIFEKTTHQMESLEKIYRRIFPDWDQIEVIDGRLTCSKEMRSYICKKFQQLTRKHHPEIFRGGTRLNNGFSTTEHLRGWEINKNYLPNRIGGVTGMLKRIGVLWNKEDKNKQPYFSGTLDLGVLGEAQIMVFPNKHKEEEHHPDAVISLVVSSDDDPK